MEEQPLDQSSATNIPPRDAHKHPEAPAFSGFPVYPYGGQMIPMLYPALVSGLPQNQEVMNNGAGIYAVPVQPFMGPLTGLPSNNLVPLTFNIPTKIIALRGRDALCFRGRGQGKCLWCAFPAKIDGMEWHVVGF